MKLLHWFCTISIFLCATFTASAQAIEAVEYERVLYNGASPAQANAALLGRAECLIQLQRYTDALDALDRLRLFALSAEERLTGNHLKGVSLFRTGNYAGALVCFNEGFPSGKAAERDAVLILAGDGKYDEALNKAVALDSEKAPQLRKLFAEAPKARNATTAFILSFIPPLGHIYLKEKNWLPTTLMSYAGAALTAWQAVEANYITAIVGGGILLNASYMEHNLATVQQRTAAADEAAVTEFLTKLEKLLDE